MAVDDAVVGRADLVSTGSLLIIRPTTSGEEWTIHNIYVPFGKKIGLHRSNDPTGVNLGISMGQIPFSLTGQYNFHCTNDEFLILVNGESTSITVGYDGIVTRSP